MMKKEVPVFGVVSKQPIKLKFKTAISKHNFLYEVNIIPDF